MVYSTGDGETRIDSKIDLAKLQEKTNIPILPSEPTNDPIEETPILLNDKKYIAKLSDESSRSICDGESSLRKMLNDILERRMLHKAFYLDDEHPETVKRAWIKETIDSLYATKSKAESSVRACDRMIAELTDEYNKSLTSTNEVDDEKEYYELLHMARCDAELNNKIYQYIDTSTDNLTICTGGFYK